MIFYTDPKDVPVAAHGIALVDTIKDQPKGVLGYHTEDPGGKLWGVVAANRSSTTAARPTTGDWSVSSVLSHEVLEMYIDPNCNLWANDGQGRRTASRCATRSRRRPMRSTVSRSPTS